LGEHAPVVGDQGCGHIVRWLLQCGNRCALYRQGPCYRRKCRTLAQMRWPLGLRSCWNVESPRGLMLRPSSLGRLCQTASLSPAVVEMTNEPDDKSATHAAHAVSPEAVVPSFQCHWRLLSWQSVLAQDVCDAVPCPSSDVSVQGCECAVGMRIVHCRAVIPWWCWEYCVDSCVVACDGVVSWMQIVQLQA
jgi:hypothetical protein